jgi:translation initiation factor 2 subunit 2
LDSERDAFLGFLDHAGEDENGEGADLQQQQQRNPWDGTDRDYEYEEVQ